jgi:alpha-1,3-rhamnosyl/mannosyltransferase
LAASGVALHIKGTLGLKLLVNLACMQPPLTGIGHYTRQLATCVAMHSDVTAFRGLYRSRWLNAAQLHGRQTDASPADTSAKHYAGSGIKRLLRLVPGSYPLRHRLRQRHFSRQARHYQDHVYWEPGIELMPFAGQRVATLYDLSHIAMPASHPPRRVAYLTRQVDNTLRHADAIVTISHAMRRDIAAYSGINAADIAVVPPAAGRDFYPRTPEQTAEVRARHGLPAQFILSVGTLEPRKNLSRLLRAYEQLPRALRAEWPLVCVGAKGWNDAALNADVARLESRGELIRLGYVPQQDLPLLVASAGLLSYPSLYEGFGMPVVEAMASGVPVLTSRHTSMHEITQEQAFLVNPRDTEEIRMALRHALEDPDARARLGRHGIQQAARYRWDTSARRLLAVFNEVRLSP